MRFRSKLQLGLWGVLGAALVLWGASYPARWDISHSGASYTILGLDWGRVVFCRWDGLDFHPPGWDASVRAPDPHDIDPLYTANGIAFLGIRAHHSTPPKGIGSFVILPIWLIALPLVALVVVLKWRDRRNVSQRGFEPDVPTKG